MVNTGKASNLSQNDAVFLRAYDNILDHRMQINYTNNINSCYAQASFLPQLHTLIRSLQ